MVSIRDKILNINNKSNLFFEEKKHKYFINENFELTSVTKYLSKFFPFDLNKVARDVAEREWRTEDEVLGEWEVLRDSGSKIHDIADRYCRGEELSDIELENIGGVVAFFNEYDYFEIIASEIKIFSKKYNIAGTIDLILKDKNTNRLYILDWKTSRKEINKEDCFSMAKGPFEELFNNKFYKYSAQLSFYSNILKENYNIEIWDFFFVHLRYDGTFKKFDAINLTYDIENYLKIY